MKKVIKNIVCIFILISILLSNSVSISAKSNFRINSILKTSKSTVCIKWKKVSNVHGYLIYRSNSKNKGYKLIGEQKEYEYCGVSMHSFLLWV